MSFVNTPTPNPNIGLYTPGLPELAVQGSERIPTDVPNDDGVNPATGYVQAGRLMGGALPAVSGRFYTFVDGQTPVAILTVTATLYAYPINIANTIDVATLNISCTTGQTGGACHIGIYKDNGEGYPGALVYDSGAVSGLTSTTVVTHTPSDTLTLQAGAYWVATIFTASGTFPSVAGITANYSAATNMLLGSDTAAHALATSGQAATGISVAGTYGDLPSTFTAGATLTLNAATPLIAIEAD